MSIASTFAAVKAIFVNFPTIWKWSSIGISFYGDLKTAIDTLPDMSDETIMKTWCQKNAAVCVHYAGLTDFTQIDDKAAQILNTVVSDYWGVVWYAVNQIKNGKEPDPIVAAEQTQTVYASAADSDKTVGNPLLIIGIISLVINGLRLIKMLKEDGVEVQPSPIQTPKVREKIRNALQKLLHRETR